MPTRNVPVADAGPLVADVMLRAPRTVTAATTVSEARAAFENPRVRLLLVTDRGRFLGTVAREQVKDGLDGAVALEAVVDADSPSVSPADPAGVALNLLEARGSERLPVVDQDGTLVGLVCFNRSRGHFCVDR